MMEETLRLQFGTAATTIGTQWLALCSDNQRDARLNRLDGKPRMLAFEAKDRVQRRRTLPSKRPRVAELQQQAAWTGGVQLYDQSAQDASTGGGGGGGDAGLWSWASCDASHLVEVSEFRAHMALHNVFEGGAGGSVARATFDAAEERLRGELEACDRLRLVQSLVDMDSSWGGFAHEVLSYVADECPSAVVATFGTDWAYPLADDTTRDVAVVRDNAKVAARRRLNLAASLSLLAEVSTLLVPVALALPPTRFRHLRGLDRRSCAEVGSVAATAIELALAAHRPPRSVYELVAGLPPSMKVAELAASFPFAGDPVALLSRLANATEVAPAGDVLEEQFSLLPAATPAAAGRRGGHGDYDDDDEGEEDDGADRVFYRRLHLYGTFASASSLADAIDRVHSASCVAQWTPTALQLPASYRVASLAGRSVDAISQLSTSSRVGRYLRHTARGVERVDKRVLFEFTRAGMSPDALDDMAAALGALGDAYFP
ncbi:hypothetical protein PybrP1_007450 [[Pythium] brassicae (nom. inval.)]|nr:hypothetical protein PybrP1_007450 [[Pythium] brassicae (nom. inval.)]